MDTRPIGVFDSGLGGLTAVRQLRRVLPGEDIVYFGDTGRVPYGSRGRDIIVQYARQDIRFLLQQDVKFIIAACGTVSSTYPPEEAARLPVPFTGVVGATARAAVDATRNRKIGIIGTAATVRSGSYAAIIRDMMPDVQIFARACPMFVPLVENGYFNDGNPVTKLIIAEYLQELKDAGVDTLILGCTHYPLLKKMIGDFMGDEVHLVDSGKVTAQAAAAALDDLGLLNGKKVGGTARYFVSDTPDNFDELAHTFLGEYAGGPVDRIAIETYEGKRASPIGGKLSPKVTDEGRVAVAAHLPGNDGRSPLIRPCGPPSPEGEGFSVEVHHGRKLSDHHQGHDGAAGRHGYRGADDPRLARPQGRCLLYCLQGDRDHRL